MDVAIAVVVTVGPLVAILVALARPIRRALRRRTASPPMPRPGAGSGGPQHAGDRSPLRPLTPMLSGGAALPLPIDDDPLEDVIARAAS